MIIFFILFTIILSGCTRSATTPPPVTLSPSPLPQLWETYTNPTLKFEFKTPKSWKLINGSPTTDSTFTLRQNDYDLVLTTTPTSAKTIQIYLDTTDKAAQTGWEGTPSYTVLSTRKTIINGLNVIQREENWHAAAFAKPVLATYFLNLDNHTIYTLSLRYLGSNTSNTANLDYPQILASFNFIRSGSTPPPYTCPENGWVNCMPGPNQPNLDSCTPAAVSWFQTHCPNFKGIAQ